MKWNKYTLKTTTEAIDYISGLMIELGIDGIQIEDNVPLSEEDKKAMFIDYLPTLPKDDGTAYISFYTEEDNDDEALLHKVREKLKEASLFINVGEGTIEKDITVTVEFADGKVVDSSIRISDNENIPYSTVSAVTPKVNNEDYHVRGTRCWKGNPGKTDCW